MLEEVKEMREGGQGGKGAGRMFKNSNLAVFRLHRSELRDRDAPSLCRASFAALRSLSGGFHFYLRLDASKTDSSVLSK